MAGRGDHCQQKKFVVHRNKKKAKLQRAKSSVSQCGTEDLERITSAYQHKRYEQQTRTSAFWFCTWRPGCLKCRRRNTLTLQMVPVFPRQQLHEAVQSLPLGFVQFVTDIFAVVFFQIEAGHGRQYLDQFRQMIQAGCQCCIETPNQLIIKWFCTDPGCIHERQSRPCCPCFPEVEYVREALPQSDGPVANDQRCGIALDLRFKTFRCRFKFRLNMPVVFAQHPGKFDGSTRMKIEQDSFDFGKRFFGKNANRFYGTHGANAII